MTPCQLTLNSSRWSPAIWSFTALSTTTRSLGRRSTAWYMLKYLLGVRLATRPLALGGKKELWNTSIPISSNRHPTIRSSSTTSLLTPGLKASVNLTALITLGTAQTCSGLLARTLSLEFQQVTVTTMKLTLTLLTLTQKIAAIKPALVTCNPWPRNALLVLATTPN